MLTSPGYNSAVAAAPFDTELLDKLMDKAGLDVIIATSKHNVQYLLGGHRSNFFDVMDAMGVSRYLPVMVYPKGQPEKATFIGHRLEGHQREVKPFWVTESQTNSSTSTDGVAKAMAYLEQSGIAVKRIGVEASFLPFDTANMLKSAAPASELVEAVPVLERLRACKRPEELAMLREASERVIGAMGAALKQHGPGSTKQEFTDTLRREEVARGMTFEYCLIAAGKSFNRAPSDQRWEIGDVMSIDSGGNYRGYIGDIARMAILGEPDAELVDLLGLIEEAQQAAFRPVRAGVLGGEVYVGPEAVIARSPLRDDIDFIGHGMGLVSHEIPHLTDRGPTPYPGDGAREPLEAGMVLSIETTMKHPTRGFIKLEDTVVVTADGYEIFGNGMRGWNRGAA